MKRLGTECPQADSRQNVGAPIREKIRRDAQLGYGDCTNGRLISWGKLLVEQLQDEATFRLGDSLEKDLLPSVLVAWAGITRAAKNAISEVMVTNLEKQRFMNEVFV